MHVDLKLPRVMAGGEMKKSGSQPGKPAVIMRATLSSLANYTKKHRAWII